MRTVILAGGVGTRLREETVVKPKPMVEIGGRPILWHIMKIYAAHNFEEFCVALGYKGDYIKDYFLNYFYRKNNLTIHLDSGNVEITDGFEGPDPETDGWLVHLINTGANTGSGGRLKRLTSWLGNKTFMMTYGDGVADIDIKNLIAFHRSHGKLATVTVVRPPARFGSLQFDGDRVTAFVEKPQMGEGWINGGFFVLEPGVLDYIEGDGTSFERAPLENLARDEQIMAYRHDGFWQCMDTLRDVQLLERLWGKGDAPWKIW